jgi:type I restriction enzyme S subunit
MYLLRLNLEIIDINYFLQILNSSKTRDYFSSVKHNSSQGYLKAEHVEELIIPVPPLEEQRRIASILDSLKSMTIDITIGLPAEIAARRTQYEYYRNKLLTFKELEVA